MDAETFLRHLREALTATWEEAGVRPQNPREYSTYIFAALARVAETAGMEYRRLSKFSCSG
jgi:hypothetical protein